MGFIVVFLGLLGFYFIVVKYLNISSEKCLFILTSTLILLLYWFAYFNLLLLGAWLILLLGLVALIISPFILYQDKEIIFTKYITPVFAFTLIYIVILSILSTGLHVSRWDEFSHWGPYIKYMFLHNGFIQASDVVALKAYPPGSSLFYYLFCLAGGFSEGTIYAAQQLLMLVAIPVVLKNIRWKDWPAAFLGYSILLLAFKLFHTQIGFTGSLYVDALIGIYFGSIIMYYRLSNRKSLDILLLIPPVFALSIFKSHLFSIVLAITSFVIFDQLLQAFYFLRANRKVSLILTKSKVIFIRVFSILLIPASSLLAIITWDRYLEKSNIAISWDLHVTKTQLLNLFTGKNLDSTKLTVIMNYKHTLLGEPLIFLTVCAILAGLIFILCKQEKDRHAIILDNAFMFLGFIGYLFSLLLMYIFLFSSYEGLRLASFDRYISIYYIAWSMVILAGLFKALQPYKLLKKRNIQFILAGLVILGMGIITMRHYHRINKPSAKIRRNNWRFRQAIQQITDKVKLYTNLQDRIFLVWQGGEHGDIASIVRYKLIPRLMAGNASFISHPSTTNIWANYWSSQQFTQALQNYDYLLLGYTDKDFWQMFGKLFSTKPPYLKPLVNYTVCTDIGGCYGFKTEQAYLFKIYKKGGKIQLVNVR
jgi:hypothetical protein